MKARWPNFRINVFAIPKLMEDSDWKQLGKRQEWMRVYPHGFRHVKKECRTANGFKRHLRLFDRIARDKRWGKLFKAPWHGYCPEAIRECHERGFAVAAKAISFFPFPMPDGWRMWNISDAYIAANRDATKHIEAHPVYGPSIRPMKATLTEISRDHVRKWTRSWRETDHWAFVDEWTRPALLKINLGCGPQVWDGWACVDNRQTDPRVISRDIINQQLPWGDNKADIIFSSHVWNYIPEDKWEDVALEIWRVLRPGAVYRLAEDRTDNGYIWRRPGQQHFTGLIVSLPTKGKILNCLRRIGFEVHDSEPGSTISPHKDVLQGDTRARRYRLGHKFYCEAVKAIDIPDISRPRWYDVRATRAGRYRMPPEISAA